MAKVATKSKPLLIAVVGVHTLQNLRLYDAFILLSQNLADAYYQMDDNNFDHSSPIKLRFADPLLIFWRNQTTQILRNFENLLRASNGVVINLGGRVLDVDYLRGNTPPAFFSVQLEKLIDFICKANLPAVLAIEDVKDSFESVELFFDKETLEGGGEMWGSEFKPPTVIPIKDDIWEPSSPIIQSVKTVLKVPNNMPTLSYSYRRPISIQNILTALLTEIKKSQVGGA